MTPDIKIFQLHQFEAFAVGIDSINLDFGIIQVAKPIELIAMHVNAGEQEVGMPVRYISGSLFIDADNYSINTEDQMEGLTLGSTVTIDPQLTVLFTPDNPLMKLNKVIRGNNCNLAITGYASLGRIATGNGSSDIFLTIYYRYT